jgi:hypothetical protein
MLTETNLRRAFLRLDFSVHMCGDVPDTQLKAVENKTL